MFKTSVLVGVIAALFDNQVAASSVNHSWPEACSTPIDRLKAGPDDYETIISNNSTTKYEDLSFNVGEIVQWASYPGESSLSRVNRKINNWYYMNEKYPEFSMFGVATEQYDLAQGQIGDCYFIAGCASTASYPRRIEDAFATKEMNDAGIYAMNIYAMGIPTQITIDGRIPFSRYGEPVFANIGYDGAQWGPLIEKAWAKMNGNYEQIVGGWMKEAVNFLNNSPATTYMNTDYSSSQIWSMIDNAFNKEWEVGAETQYDEGGDQAKSPYGLAYSHAYVVLGTDQLKDQYGNVQYNLLRIRNPWRSETYSGPWSDDDPRWTDTYKEQVDYINRDDGVFFTDMDSFKDGFESFTLIYSANEQIQSWYYDTNVPKRSYSSYTFTLTQTQDLFVDALTWGSRAYPNGCADYSIFYTDLYYEGSYVDSANYYVQAGFDTIAVENAKPGKYTMKVKPQWGSGTNNELTVRVTASEDVNVYDSQGNTNQVTWFAHDDSESPYHDEDDVVDPPAPEPDTPDDLMTMLTNWMAEVDESYPMSPYSYSGSMFMTQNYLDDTYTRVGIEVLSTYNELNVDFSVTISASSGSSIITSPSDYSSCTKYEYYSMDYYSCTCQVRVNENYNCGYLVQLEDYYSEFNSEWDYTNYWWS